MPPRGGADMTMLSLNPNAIHAREGALEIFIEDIRDPDDQWYRLEYRCAPLGDHANAYVISKPWSDNPFTFEQSHLNQDGFICIGPAANGPYELDYVVPRARLWCIGYSFLREHGYEATCAVLPEWRSG